VVFFGHIGFSGIPYGHRSSDRSKGFEANLPCVPLPAILSKPGNVSMPRPRPNRAGVVTKPRSELSQGGVCVG
jgi:hypothetical protein